MRKLDRSTLSVDPGRVQVGTVWRFDWDTRLVRVLSFSFRGVYFWNVCECGHPADGVERYDWKPDFLGRVRGPGAIAMRSRCPAINIGLPAEYSVIPYPETYLGRIPPHLLRATKVPPPGVPLLAAPPPAVSGF